MINNKLDIAILAAGKGTRMGIGISKVLVNLKGSGRPGSNRRPSVWSGQRESDPQLNLGKVAYYHYTMPANF